MDRREFLQIAGATATVPVLGSCGGSGKHADSAVPQSNFGAESTAEQVTEGMDLSGRIAVVTGCNSGIGFETMRVLAMRGAYVIGTGRTLEKAQAACKQVVGGTTPVALELSDFDSIVACADAIRSLNAPIDMLICNAGMRGGEHAQIGGIEKHFFVNHLGHFLLVNRLVDRMYFANQGRVVVVGSRAAYRNAPEVGIEFDNLDGEKDYSVSKAYGHSKLANSLFSLELAQRLKGSRITSNCVHPGLIDTNIVRQESRLIRAAWTLITSVRGKTVAEGAATSCFVATNPILDTTSGAYFEDCNAVTIDGEHYIDDREMALRLWQLSEKLVGDYLVQHGPPDWREFEHGPRRRQPAAQTD